MAFKLPDAYCLRCGVVGRLLYLNIFTGMLVCKSCKDKLK
jgi:hypothetical protein